MRDKGFLDLSVSSLTLEFITFNPINKRGLAYVIIYFVVNDAGVVISKIDVTSIKKNSL
jgi:hypothetical protein